MKKIMSGIETRKPDTDLEQMIIRYRPVVSFKVRKSLGGGNPDWEDVVNEIMMQVIEKIKSGEFRGESSVGTFIYTITSRRIIDYIRQKMRVLKHAPEVNPLPDPHDQVERDERAARLAEAIKQLKPKFKDVLYLYYFKDLTREEVARKLGISPAKVSERVNYAQKLLRKILTG
jgi:RNA polymerase sigma-70 factor (ECF subfamily)